MPCHYVGKGTEAALALAAIATLSLAISNVINGVMPIMLTRPTYVHQRVILKHLCSTGIGLIGLAKNVLLVGLAYYLGAGAVQNLLDWIPTFIMDGFVLPPIFFLPWFCYARQTCSQAKSCLLLPGLLAPRI